MALGETGVYGHARCFVKASMSDVRFDSTELIRRRGSGLHPWLGQRFHEFLPVDAKEDIIANLSMPPNAT